ncbi:class I glutamine amidotransferase-like protein [Zymoseptoria brevis]|uniref:Class I glutamine amidotransferase-like protein n=1 Tax=Zymoseptoria brevis TaxID=1047168 RepID=A0A0F4G710_9PEZI|nr:class I glutamine amidotransferase-like protein [Zymoseptoria brevis]
MLRETVKILVLETDETDPRTKKKHGGFGDVFRDLFQTAGRSHEPPLDVELDMHFVVDDPDKGLHGHVPKAFEIPKSFNAILITGSTYDAHDESMQWVMELRLLVEELWRTRPDMYFSGVCFGHQLLARALGAKVESAPGERWELAHTSLDLTPVGQKLFRTEDRHLAVHQMHQDHVTTIPSVVGTDLLAPNAKVHVWASTEHTRIQGLYIRDRLFTSQGHLGFDEDMVRGQIEARIASGAIDDDDAKEVAYADETAHMEHDGEVVAAAILRFFHGDDHDVD